MGYHVIFREQKDQIRHEYVKESYELANLPITENTIIYKGEEHWCPVVVKNSEEYKRLSDFRYRGSVLAERIFMRQALENGLMIEVLEQNQKSFEQYYKVHDGFLNIKRGDFLIRNVGNLEVEVKCKTFYGRKSQKHFYFEKEHFEKHLKMREYTRAPILLAVYERKASDGKPNPKSLYMIDMIHILSLIKNGSAKQVKRDWGAAYQIKVNNCMKGFKLVDFYKNKYNIE